MNNPQNQDRVRKLYQMLFEMATGNLGFRLPESVSGDGIDGIAEMLNRVAEEMEAAIISSGYVRPRYEYQGLLQASVILNAKFLVRSFTEDVPGILGYKPWELLDLEFVNLLSKRSKADWETAVADLQAVGRFVSPLPLVFIRLDGKAVPSYCTVSRLHFGTKILISSVTTIVKDPSEIYRYTPAPARPNDSKAVQEVYEYILKNLEEPLPTVRKLARLFGTNEHKLREGFKHFFKTSIYQFYNDERLRKAHILIEQTDLSIKTVALMSGFNDYTTFYKSFRKKYGYAPSELWRKTL